MSGMILTITPNALLDYILHSPAPPAQGAHRLSALPWMVGGKGINVARMLKTLGVPGLALTFAGGPNGEKIRRGLADEGIAFRCVPTAHETRVGVNLVVETPPSQMWWIEEGFELGEPEVLEFLQLTRAFLPKTRFLVMSGTVPGRGNRDFYRRIIDEAKAFVPEIYLDARGACLTEALKSGSFFLKQNRDEARETFGLDPFIPAESEILFGRLREAGVWGAFITDGPRPTLLWEPGKKTVLEPPRLAEVSAVGSGDAAMAGFVFGRRSGLDLIDSAKWALAAGSADAAHPGPCQAAFPEIERLFKASFPEKDR